MRPGFKKNALIFLGIVIVIAGGYWIWDRFFSEMGRLRRQAKEQIEYLEKSEKTYIAAATADTYGGKTPQETLDLFVAALKKGDVELAHKYFLLDATASREKWLTYLNGVKTKNLLNKMASDISLRAKPDLEERTGENDFKFVLYDDNQDVGARINMQFNTYAKIWKIESL